MCGTVTYLQFMKHSWNNFSTNLSRSVPDVSDDSSIEDEIEKNSGAVEPAGLPDRRRPSKGQRSSGVAKRRRLSSAGEKAASAKRRKGKSPL
jgi:hypothetical protein